MPASGKWACMSGVHGGGLVKSLLCVVQGVVRPSDSFQVCYKIIAQ